MLYKALLPPVCCAKQKKKIDVKHGTLSIYLVVSFIAIALFVLTVASIVSAATSQMRKYKKHITKKA